MSEHEAAAALVDGRHLHARLAQRGAVLGQLHFPAGGGAVEHADAGVRLQRGGGAEQPQVRAGHGDKAGPVLLFLVFLGRRGLALAQELDLVLAHLDDIVMRQAVPLDGRAIDVGAVGALQVLDVDLGSQQMEQGVLTADRQVVDHEVVVGPAAQGRLFLGERGLPHQHAVQRNHQFVHSACLLPCAAASPPARTSTTEMLSLPPAALAASTSAWQASCSEA